MEILAQTRIVMWEGASLWVVDASPAAGRTRQQTDLHAHHAIQVAFSLGGVFRLQSADGRDSRLAAAVAADAGHLFEAEGLIGLLFVEPESRAGHAIAARLFGDKPLALLAEPLPAGGLIEAFHSGDDAALIAHGRALVTHLAGGEGGHRPDLRVRRMIAAAAQRLEGQVSLADVVADGGLSAGRLRHLFVEQTGLPFKTYVLWMRMMRAVERIAAGAALTAAAHDAGFADSAHFSRTFRRMFGVAPASLRIT